MTTLHQTLLKSMLACLLFLGLESGISAAPTYTDLHDFNCAIEGCQPYYPAILAQGRDGNLYGTTYAGGTSTKGTVFKVTPAGTVTTLYNFDGPHGSLPYGGLTLGTDGNFYGTTLSGGTVGSGTIFKITPTGTLTVLHNFGTTIGDGYNPYGAPIQGADGYFYGVTYKGAAYRASSYKVSSSGVFKVLNSAAYGTEAQLIQANDGNFYGTSEYNNVVFKMTTTGKVTILYTFDNTHGSSPRGPVVQGADGNLYGTTRDGGSLGHGVVFKLSLKGVITVLKNFDPSIYSSPYAGLVAGNDGNFYGATLRGDNLSVGDGVLFKITKTGTITVESSFDETHGSYAYATPIQHTNGKIYGLTKNGGVVIGGISGTGVFYSLDESLAPFAGMTSAAAKVGVTVGILGQGFTGASAVSFGGTAATTFTVVSDTYMTAKVPSGALTGIVTVTRPAGTLSSYRVFRVLPAILSFIPTTGPVGTLVTITGSGLSQTSKITIGGKTATPFNVNSDSQVVANVPTGAVTGKVVITTLGGKATSAGTFTVTP